MSQLTLGFVPDDHDDTNRLELAVQTDDFAGRGWCWTDRASLESFASRLRAYPIPRGEPATFTMGYNHLHEEDLIGRVEVGPADRLGNILVRVEVADPDQPWRRVRAEFRTHYPELERFSAQIARMLSGDIGTATLLGE